MIDFKDDEFFIKHFLGLGLEIGLQIPMLAVIVFSPERLVFIPREDYDFIFAVLLKNEYYEYLVKMKAVEDKIKDISLKHFYQI